MRYLLFTPAEKMKDLPRILSVIREEYTMLCLAVDRRQPILITEKDEPTFREFKIPYVLLGYSTPTESPYAACFEVLE